MKFDPKIHHRNSIRRPDFDYSHWGPYFVTICARNRECIFGEITGDQPVLSDLGHIIENEWLALPQRFPEIQLDEYIVMPNHFHGIICLAEINIASKKMEDTKIKTGVEVNPTLGDIICAFKSLVFKRYYDFVRQNNLHEIAKCWQRNYWERIIRDNREFENIRHYIATNPEKWADDSDNLDRLLSRMTERKDR
jgi:putative transposase